jgi:hypothetical protein
MAKGSATTNIFRTDKTKTSSKFHHILKIKSNKNHFLIQCPAKLWVRDEANNTKDR